MGKVPLTLLLDSGSTHNLLSEEFAVQVGIHPDVEERLSVTVANGDKLLCEGCCSSVQLCIQVIEFVLDFYILAIEGCDAVLGTQWLRSLGPVWWDFD